MFHLWINKVVHFTSKLFEKHQWKSDILSKDADHSSTGVFQTFC